MDEFVGEDDGRWEVVLALWQQRRGECGDAGEVGLLGFTGIETERRITTAGEHDVMTQ